MAYNHDWLPRKMEERLETAKNWLVQIKAKGKSLWKMEQELIDEFEDAVTLAGDEFSRPQANRNVGTNVQLKEAFEKLTAKMRDIKKRYFFVPPLTNADLALLGLHPKDENPTPVAAPRSQVSADVHCPGKGLVELKNIRPVGEYLDIRANYGVRIYYGILGEATDNDRCRISAAPRTGNDLPHSVFTRHKKHLFDFAGDNGKQVFFCLRYENGKGETGPWGDVLQVYIS